MNKKELLKKLKEHTKKHSIKLNPNKKQLNLILDVLIKNKKEQGKLYCPCKVSVICPCSDHLKEIKSTGKCHCNLFVS